MVRFYFKILSCQAWSIFSFIQAIILIFRASLPRNACLLTRPASAKTNDRLSEEPLQSPTTFNCHGNVLQLLPSDSKPVKSKTHLSLPPKTTIYSICQGSLFSGIQCFSQRYFLYLSRRFSDGYSLFFFFLFFFLLMVR